MATAKLRYVYRDRDRQGRHALPPYRISHRLDSAFAPLADEHQKPKRAHDELDRHVEEEDGAWHAVDDEAEDPPEGQ